MLCLFAYFRPMWGPDGGLLLDCAELRKSDTGWYTCKALSETGETSSSAALVVEAPTNHDIIFRRTPEPSTYPGPPSKPSVSDVRQSSVRLAWKENPNNGASVVVAFVVEYFSPDSGEVLDNLRSVHWRLTPTVTSCHMVRCCQLGSSVLGVSCLFKSSEKNYRLTN